MNFSIDDFTVVSHTTDSFTFTSAHPFFPGWVRVVGAHREYRVRNTPCAHNPEEEQRAKRKVRRDVEPPEVRRFLQQELLQKVGHSWWSRPRLYRYDLADEQEPTLSVRSVVVIPSDLEQPEVSPEQQWSGPSGSRDRMTLVGPVASLVTSLPRTQGQDILLTGDAEESPRTKEGRVAAATLEQEMGRRSVAAAIRPIKDRAVASSSSAAEPITQEMVAEACHTLVRERHPASPPVWPEGSEPPTRSDPDRTRGTEILPEPPLRRRLAPRPERGGSPRGTEQGPAPAMFSPSPVVRQEKQLPMRSHVLETEESESDRSGGPGDRLGPKEDPPHLMARPMSDLEGDREGAEPEQEEVMGAEPAAHLELAILNGLDISSLPALRDLSTGASTTVNIPWPPARMEQATPEWRQRASQAMAFLLGGRSGEHYGNWSDALRQRPECRLDPPDTTTRRGIWTARMHNSTVCRVLDGLVSARATGHREPEGMNEILRDIPPRRGVLPIPEPDRGSPRVDETFPETGE